MSEEISIRMATVEDAAQIQAIYAPYVRDTAISFEVEPPDEAEFRRRISATLEKFPYLVAELKGEIVAYAYAAPFHSRAAYVWTVETSIYVRQGMTHSGVGQLLYRELEQRLRRQHVVNLVAVIIYPNQPSINFHLKQGFSQVGHFANSGYKLGQWRDIVWLVKRINQFEDPPQPVLFLHDM